MRGRGLAVVIEPGGTLTPLDANFTATVTAVGDGEAIAGADVVLSTVMPSLDDAPQSGQTGEVGGTGFPWTRETPGLEQVLAEVTVDGDTGPSEMAHPWGHRSDHPASKSLAAAGLASAPEVATGRGCPWESDVAFFVGRQRIGGARAVESSRVVYDGPE